MLQNKSLSLFSRDFMMKPRLRSVYSCRKKDQWKNIFPLLKEPVIAFLWQGINSHIPMLDMAIGLPCELSRRHPLLCMREK